MDRRVRRTRRILGEALVQLIIEQGYERTTVQDVLDRADVGRSTFYAHFRDKDALLMAGFEDLAERLRADLDAMSPGVPPEPGQPVVGLFSHAYRNRTVYAALFGRRGGTAFRQRLHELLAGLLRAHLAPHLAAARSDLPVDVVVEFATSAAIGLLVWWIDDGFRFPPERMALMYQRMAVPGIGAAVGGAGPPPAGAVRSPRRFTGSAQRAGNRHPDR
ncbi:TetR/AcrR family transcriptional regulator [Dactylosporangium sp. NPDC048998]|uniref:TetR/AcrR family transcriptional regulator n=1 Tax=Dactylosporangium sp. NPDC048998 TaxID=3363976 RepID=UPI0037117F2F